MPAENMSRQCMIGFCDVANKGTLLCALITVHYAKTSACLLAWGLRCGSTRFDAAQCVMSSEHDYVSIG